MVIHTMKFSDFNHKMDATEWLKNEVFDLDHIDECLGDSKIVFVTGCELTKHLLLRMTRELLFTTYESHDL